MRGRQIDGHAGLMLATLQPLRRHTRSMQRRLKRALHTRTGLAVCSRTRRRRKRIVAVYFQRVPALLLMDCCPAAAAGTC